MKFSVIIPLYNKLDYILAAVESVISQTYADFELLVVDDGSTDGSSEILDGSVRDPRIRIIRQMNQGGAGGQARNAGMAAAQGEWFAFLDADDIWLPNHLTELAAIIEHADQPALISTRPTELPAGTVPSLDLRDASIISEVNYFRVAGRCIGHNNCSSSAIHRDIFERLGGFINVRSGPDLEYWARVSLDYPYFASDRVTSVYYRGNMGNMEQIASQFQDSQQPIPVHLSDVSPSLEMISNRAARNMALFERDDIRAYVNGRLLAGVRISIRRSQPKKALALSGLMIGPVGWRTHALAVVALLPTPLIRGLNMAYDLAKKGNPQ